MRTSKQLLFILSFLLSVAFATAQSVTWELHHGQGEGIFVPGSDDPSIEEILNELTGGKQPVHGDPGGFVYADIPSTDDAGWEAAPIDEDGDLCWRLNRSRLGGFMTALDFTYFQTTINVTNVNAPFILNFYEVDDGARAYVFNSANPDGAFVEGGDVRLYATPVQTDVSPLFVEGENRIVIVQFDDSQTANYLKVETIAEDEVDECEDDITVTAEDDNFNINAGETLTFVVSSLTNNDSASDGSDLELQSLILVNPDNGTLTGNGDGSYDFVPADGFSGEVLLNYTVRAADKPLYFEGTGNFYEQVSGGITWENARDAAAAKTLNGEAGYLATITSQAENDFILELGEGWIGASDAEEEDVWRWVTGPESGQQFWQGKGDGSTVDGMFANWNPGQPEDNGGENNEQYAYFFSGGTWGDFPGNGGSPRGYLVEYASVDGCALDFSGEATVTITVTENVDDCEDDTEAPVISSYSVGTFIDGEQVGSFQIDIVEGEPNVLEVECGLSRLNNFGIGSSTGVDDNCSDLFGLSTNTEETSRTTREDGSLEITEIYTITDESDNSREYTITTVYLSDTQTPQFEGCPADVVTIQLNESGTAAPSLDDLGISVTDDCTASVDDLTITYEPEVITAETQECIITAMDAEGNTAECRFPVNPISGDPCANGTDSEDPIIDGCPGDVVIVELDANGEARPSLDSLGITISDNCGSVEDGDLTIIYDPEVITANTQVCIITVIDANGNQAECQFPVEPVPGECANDIEAPQFFVETGLGERIPFEEFTVEEEYPCSPTFSIVAEDNCDPNPIILPATGIGPGGTVFQQFIATDMSGNSDTISYTFTNLNLEDTEAPMIVECPNIDLVFPASLDSTGTVLVSGREAILDATLVENNCRRKTTLEINLTVFDFGSVENDSIFVFAFFSLIDDAGNESAETCNITLKVPLENRPQTQEEVVLESRSELNETIEVNVSPNPFREEAIISVNLPAEEMMNIDVRDISGRTVKSLSLRGNAGENNFYLQRDDLATGVYFISVRTATMQQTVKAVITQ